MRFPVLLGIIILAGSVSAAEFAVLKTGSRLAAERHDTDGSKVRLHNGAGYIEIDLSMVERFETAEPVPETRAASPAPAIVRPALSPGELVDAAADRYGLPRRLVRSVASAESGLRQDAVSSKGAVGLMQLMPGTAQMLGADPNDPVQNVDAGARLLRDLLLKYDGRVYHALAAYNAGPEAVERYNGLPPYRETVNYVSRIARELKQKERAEP